MTNKEKFIQIYKENIKREGSAELLAWLEKTDFFTAPASTKFHLCEEGGLCEHSINVYECLNERYAGEHSAESIAIVSLLHDLCKAQFYKVSFRNQKNEQTGQWEKVPFYQIEDKFPFGHGEKSVFLIERFMRLKVEEAIAIRWHMGGFDDTAKAGGFTISNAFEMYPLAVKLHIADIEATYLREGVKNPDMN
ncbi:MAG: hydrolase [Clostridia bacterium]|nr:hydrolase [Clostridia bacterium]